MFRNLWSLLLCCMLSGVGMAPSAHAQDARKGKVVLTVSGGAAGSPATARVDLDMAQLLALPQRTITTQTPWFKSAQAFSGPLLRDVLALAGVQGATKLTAVALNDYRVELPVEDAHRWPVVVALRLNGQPMSVREKGPLFIIYPFDDDADLRTERYFSRAAWQLRHLEAR